MIDGPKRNSNSANAQSRRMKMIRVVFAIGICAGVVSFLAVTRRGSEDAGGNGSVAPRGSTAESPATSVVVSSAPQGARSTPPAPERVASATKELRAEQCRFVGMGTPEDSLESEMWARQQKQFKQASEIITFSQLGRDALKEMYGRLPDYIRGHFSGPEEMWATLMAGNPELISNPVVRRVITARSEMDGGDVLLDLDTTQADGKGMSEKWRYRKGEDGNWRRIYGDKMLIPWYTQPNYMASMVAQAAGLPMPPSIPDTNTRQATPLDQALYPKGPR